MAYQQNIPQSTDLLSKSQGDILGNFQAIMTLVDVNHVDFASSDQGKHFVVTMPVQSASPPSGYTFINNETGMYCFLNPTTSANEVYLHTNMSGSAIIAEVPLTASNQAAKGWCYLPSGLILKWGSATTAGSSAAVTLNGGGLGPNFTNVFQPFLTCFQGGGTIATFKVGSIILPTMNVTSNNAIATFSYLVIVN